jgi:hypothetical protein
MKLGKYRHYKGKYYKVIGIAKDCETLEDMVVYRCLHNNPISTLWVRPRKMFEEVIEVKKSTSAKVSTGKVKRFEFVE